MHRNVPVASSSFLTLKQEPKHAIRDLIRYLSCLVDKTKLAIDPSSAVDCQPETDEILKLQKFLKKRNILRKSKKLISFDY